VSQVQQRLSDDHHAIDEVLTQLLAALESKDVQRSHAKLDLLWARLAVHIRAEHLHLFPAIASRVVEAQPAIEGLRADHDFFMRTLAQTIGILRELPKHMIRPADEAKLDAVAVVVRDIEKRLEFHDEIEESKIYGWAGIILTQPEQSDLLSRINAELENRPLRFSAEAWGNPV
jgi:hypothetical protein